MYMQYIFNEWWIYYLIFNEVLIKFLMIIFINNHNYFFQKSQLVISGGQVLICNEKKLILRLRNFQKYCFNLQY
jgi:hypothetical protein